MDLLIQHGTVVTMDPQRRVLRDATVHVRDGRIVSVSEGAPKNVPAGMARVVDAKGCAVVPGFVHGHLHACQTLIRNRADGFELLDWLRQRVWPFEAAHDAASMRASAELTFAELIRSGSTSALDMGSVHHYDEVFAAARDVGFRLTGGKAMMDAGEGVPSGLLESTKDSLGESARLIRDWHGKEDGRLQYAYAPRFVLSCTEELLRTVAAESRAKGVRIHTHVSENRTECAVVREKTGMDNVAYFHSLGLTGPHACFAHGVWLTEEEQDILKSTGTHLCHCPGSNLKLASGIAPIPQMLGKGMHVCLGADGAPCNNNLDIFVEMRLAALMHKPAFGPLAMPAMDVLEMATLSGARALGIDREVGSLEAGKRADVAIVELTGLHATPAGDDVAAQLVYSCRSTDVRDVLIDGRWVMRSRQLLTLDEGLVRAKGEEHALRLTRKVLGS